MVIPIIALTLFGMGAVVAASCLLHGNGRDDELTEQEGGTDGRC
jgi:hypothetical protein